MLIGLGFEANYDAASSAYSSPTCEAGRTDGIAGCNLSLEARNSSNDSFEFIYSECSTPKVSSVTPSQGTIDTVITVHGHGFSNESCHNKVTFSSHECKVITSNDTAITCILSTAGDPIAAEALDVTVKVLNRGYAFVRADAGDTSYFVLKPSVTAVSPTSGSQAGGTLVRITGGGFRNEISGNVVQIGSAVCDVVSSSFDAIVCRTRASLEQAQQVMVTVLGSESVESECVAVDSAGCEYTFALDRTPVVTLVSPTNIKNPQTEFRFQVSRLPSSSADVTVTVGNEICVTEILPQVVKCVLPGVVFGSHKIVIHVSGKGNAEFDVSDVVHSEPLVSKVSPSQSSIHGGLIITIEGNGFNPTPGKTIVTIGSEICKIITVSYGVIECVTPPHPLSNTVVIQVTVDSDEESRRRRSAGGVFPTVIIAFTNAATPAVTSISPLIGQGGNELTIYGSGLNPGSGQGEVEVQIGDVPCAVTSSEDDRVVCTLNEHAAGSYLVDVVVPGKGRATSGVFFTYNFQIDSVDPDESGFGGGRVLVIQGQGFDQSAVVSICGSECTHNSDHNTTTTEISCEAPSHVLGSISQECDVTIILNNFIANLTNGFTYKPEMTSQITSVIPSRGGTGGGTTLTICGFGFSDTLSDNIVTIDGVVCNVTYANSSLITCQTGPHNGTIESKVRVEVGSNGKAIDHDADFSYVDVWSSPFTWGGNDPPENGMY